MWASQNSDFKKPVFGCSLQILGLNPCRNALLPLHLELFACLEWGGPRNCILLVDEGLNREQSTDNRPKLAQIC